MLPGFLKSGNLPPGVHWASRKEVQERFGQGAHRSRLLEGFRNGIDQLLKAGCKAAYLDGSFVSSKSLPGDFDVCWDVAGVDPDQLDPVFFEFEKQRATQKARFGGEFFPAQLPEGISGRTFLEFFQTDKNTGEAKGIIGIDLERWRHDQE